MADSANAFVFDATDATFERDVLERSKTTPVVVDFWAPWCGPCRTLGPLLERLTAEHAGAFLLAKVNIDDNPVTPNRFAVRGIPTLMLFKDGQAIATKVGGDSKSALSAWVEQNL